MQLFIDPEFWKLSSFGAMTYLWFGIHHLESYSWIVSSCFTDSALNIMNFRSYFLLQKEQNVIYFAIIYLIKMFPGLMSWEKIRASFSMKSIAG